MEEIGLECPICSNILKNPKTLPCGHNYCSDCLDQVFKNFKKCSMCCVTIDFIENIKVNTFIVSMIENMQNMKNITQTLKINSLNKIEQDKHEYGHGCIEKMVDIDQVIKSIPKSFIGEPMWKYIIHWSKEGLPYLVECEKEKYLLGELGIYFLADAINLMGTLEHKEKSNSLKEKLEIKNLESHLKTNLNVDPNKSPFENYQIVTTEKIRHFLYEKRKTDFRRDYLSLLNVLLVWKNNFLVDFFTFNSSKISIESSMLYECFYYAFICYEVSLAGMSEKPKPSDLAIVSMTIIGKGDINSLRDKIRDFYHLQKCHIHSATKIEVERIIAYAILIYQAKKNEYFSCKNLEYPFDSIEDLMGTKGLPSTISSVKELRDYWAQLKIFISKIPEVKKLLKK